jgi:predicted nuclease of predicted toxin-antitoxin system
MRLLANENFPLDAVEALRESGHDITWIREAARGSKDEDVLTLAQQEDRILVTFDKDFGELAFRSKLPSTSGVILFRISAPSSQYIADVAVQALASRSDWAGHFSVVEDHRIRMTLLPKSQST